MSHEIRQNIGEQSSSVERKSETQSFRDAIERLIGKLEGGDARDLSGELRQKVGDLRQITITEDVVRTVAEVMKRHNKTFEIKYNGKIYPERTN